MQTHTPDPVEFNRALEKAFSDFSAGNFDAAEPVLKEALPALGENRDMSASCLEKLIDISTSRGDYGEAIRQNLRLLSVVKATFGEFDPRVRARLTNLATLYETVGRLEEAEYMYTRAAMLEDRLIEANLSEEQEGLAKYDPSKKTASNLGPEPAWLAQAFADANQIWGKPAPLKAEKGAAAIEVEISLPTGHHFRPVEEAVQEGAKLTDITEFGQRVSQPASESTGQQASPSASKNVKSNLRTPPAAKNNSSIEKIAIKDEISFPEQSTYSARMKRFEDPTAPGPAPGVPTSEVEPNWSFLSKLVEHRLEQKPNKHATDEKPAMSYGSRRKEEKKPEGGQVYVAKAGPSEKTSGKYAKIDEGREGANLTLKDFVWRFGRFLKPLTGGGMTNHGTVRDISAEKSDPRSLTRKVPTQRTLRKSMEMNLPARAESKILRDAIHKFLSILDKAKQKDNILQSIFTIIIIGVGLLILADKVIPRRLTPADAFSQMPVSFRTAAGDIQLRLIDPGAAQLSAGDSSSRVHCCMFLGDWRDCLSISFSALIQKQHWLMRAEEGLKSDEGPLLYATGGPELQIADHMENIANLAAVIYSSLGSYPTSLAYFPKGKLAYTNPVSDETVRPSIQRLYFETDKDPLQRIHALSEGLPVPEETDIGPGNINCFSVTVQSPARSMFFVRGYDRHGLPLAGSSSGSNYYLALKDGHWVRNGNAAPSLLKWSPRRNTLWLIDGHTDGFTLFILSQGGAYFFGLMCLLLYLVKKAVQPDKATKRILSFLIPASAALAVLYSFSRFLP